MTITRIRTLPATRSKRRGGAAIEYLVVVGLLAMVLLVKPDAIPALVKSLREAYTSFVHALSIAWM